MIKIERKFVVKKLAFLFFLLIGFLLFSFPAQAQEKNSCADCHGGMEGDKGKKVVDAWKGSTHFQHAACADCHGGNPSSDDMGTAMSKSAGFKGAPEPREIPAFCAKCHADPVRMRPFNIPTSQYDQYKNSVHGKRLLTMGDTKVANCVSCHGSHNILNVKDPNSPVYKTNIPDTCGRCHSDKQYMAQYKINTNQLADYKESVHGIKLLKELDMGVPSCADCHGTHGATPPGVKEVVDVCGTCHAKVEENFNQGKHREAYLSTGEPKCITCHNNHKILSPSDRMFISGEKGVCLKCHTDNTPEYSTAKKFQSEILAVQSSYDKDLALISAAEKTHMDLSEQKAQMGNALTSLIEARVIQHSLSWEKVNEKLEEARKYFEKVESACKNAFDQSNNRKIIILITVVFCVLAAIIVYIKRKTLPPWETLNEEEIGEQK
ncbi:MAG: cytochrome c3 family protein [Firmicutes bacterium]|nr:cytochrome c3 family protein [Bacillota bacterium]